MQDVVLGRFGDARLDRAGFFYIPVSCNWVAQGYRFANLAVTEVEKSALAVSFAMSR